MPVEQLINDPGTTLAAAVTSTSATSISVVSSTGYPSGAAQFRIAVDAELMLVTNISGTTWTVVRAIESTTAATHLLGANVNAVLTAQAFLERTLNISLAEHRAIAGGTMQGSAFKNQLVTTGSTQTILNTSAGPGYLSDLYIATDQVSGHSGDSDIIVTVDGVTLFNGKYELFFAAYFFTESVAAGFSNDFVQGLGGQKISIPIPFSTSLEIQFKNNSAGNIRIWWTLGYVTGVPVSTWGRTAKLNIGTGTLNLTQDQVGTLVNQTGIGQGQLLGLYCCWDGASTNNENFLEGPFTISLDGGTAYVTSGSEDYFAMADFFIVPAAGSGNRFQTVTMKRASSTPLFAAMRFHVGEPMLFENALEVQWEAGQSSSGNSFTGNILVYFMVWYYTRN